MSVLRPLCGAPWLCPRPEGVGRIDPVCSSVANDARKHLFLFLPPSLPSSFLSDQLQSKTFADRVPRMAVPTELGVDWVLGVSWSRGQLCPGGPFPCSRQKGRDRVGAWRCQGGGGGVTGSRSPSRRSPGRRVECDPGVCPSAGSGPGRRRRSLSAHTSAAGGRPPSLARVPPPSSLGSSPNSSLLEQILLHPVVVGGLGQVAHPFWASIPLRVKERQ